VKGRRTCGVAVAAWAATAGAGAAVNGVGDLVTTFHGSLQPTSLPRSETRARRRAVAGDVKSASGNTAGLPQLLKIKRPQSTVTPVAPPSASPVIVLMPLYKPLKNIPTPPGQRLFWLYLKFSTAISTSKSLAILWFV
jgi:hypothetical protein